MLKKFLFGSICILVSFTQNGYTQDIASHKLGKLSVGLSGGLTYYNGDLSASLGSGKNLNIGPSAGITTLYRLNDHWSARGDFRIYHVSGSSENTPYPEKNLTFKTTNPDITLALQGNLIPHSKNPRINPYATLGLGFTFLTPKADWNGQTYSLAPLATEGEKYWRLPLLITGGIGANVRITPRWTVGLDMNANYIFSDYLDDVSKNYPYPDQVSPTALELAFRGNFSASPGYIRGNPKTKDAYMILSGRVYYTLYSAKYYKNKRTMRCFKYKSK